jgi:hypothetical protein
MPHLRVARVVVVSTHLACMTACAGRTASSTDAGLEDVTSSDGRVVQAPDACPWSDVNQEDAGSADDASTDADDGGCTIGDAAGIACAQSLASYCQGCPPLAGWTHFSACDSTLQSVTANPPCDVDPELSFITCPQYDVLGFSSADTAIILVYDASSGRLAAVLDSSPGGVACQAGPACIAFPPSGCTMMWSNLDCGPTGQ